LRLPAGEAATRDKMRVLLVMLGLSLVDGQKSGLALDDNQGSLEADVKPQRRHLDPACTDRNLPALGMSSYTMPWEILKGKGAFSSSYNQPKDKLKFEDGTKKVVTVYEVNKQGYDSCNKNFGPCHGIANCAVQGRKPWTCVLSTLAPGEARPASCSEAEEQATEWVGAKSVFEIEFGESHLKVRAEPKLSSSSYMRSLGARCMRAWGRERRGGRSLACCLPHAR